MKYKGYEGPIEEIVERKLREIEQAENVKIIYAVESGSRSWGFASPDSDYDVRFIYIRPEQDYLRLEKQRDVIEWELDEVLDINGWDLKKVLRYYHKSNATIFEWAGSPIVYRTTEKWKHIAKEAEKYFSPKAVMYHYYGTARSNYFRFFEEEKVKYKKYFYVIRPILACQWIWKKACPPPVLFSELMESELDEEMKPFVEKLLRIKMLSLESEKGDKIRELDFYIKKKLNELKELVNTMPNDEKKGWEELDRLFYNSIR